MRTGLLTAVALLLLAVHHPAEAQQRSRNTPTTGGTTTGTGVRTAATGTTARGAGSQNLLPSTQRQTVGPTVDDVRGMMGAMGADLGSQQANWGTTTQNRRVGAQQGQVNTGRRAANQTGVRTSLRLGFTPLPPTPARVGSSLASRLENLPHIQNRSSMEVTIEEGTAVLRGQVATEHDRMLAGRLAMLEPGIRQVRNELTIAPADDATSAP